jgi:hypothetical protein
MLGYGYDNLLDHWNVWLHVTMSPGNNRSLAFVTKDSSERKRLCVKAEEGPVYIKNVQKLLMFSNFIYNDSSIAVLYRESFISASNIVTNKYYC